MPFMQGHALLVGVGTYQDDNLSAPITLRDATALASALKNPHTASYPETQVKLLTNDGATKENILAAIRAMGNAVNQDGTVFLFLCGHGVPAPGADSSGYYFLPYEAKRDLDLLLGKMVFDPSTVLSDAELLGAIEEISAQKVLIIFNTCFSGRVAGSLGPMELATEEAPGALDAIAPSDELLDAVLGTGEGRVVLSACRQEQKSWFLTNAANTIFVQALLDGLGASSQEVANKNGYITISDLYDYVYDRVLTDIKNQLGAKYKQEPILTIRQQVGRFVVALYKGGSASAAGNLAVDASETVREPTRPGVRVITEGQAADARTRIIQANIQRTHVEDHSAQANNSAVALGGGAKVDNINTGSGTQRNIGGLNAGRDAIVGGTINRQQYGGVSFGDNATVSDQAQVVGGDLNVGPVATSTLDAPILQQVKELLDKLASDADETRNLPRPTRIVVMSHAEEAKKEADSPRAQAHLASRLGSIADALKDVGDNASTAPLNATLKKIASLVGVALP